MSLQSVSSSSATTTNSQTDSNSKKLNLPVSNIEDYKLKRFHSRRHLKSVGKTTLKLSEEVFKKYDWQ